MSAPQDDDVQSEPLIHDRGYLLVLVVAALLGVPLSMIAFGFLALVHKLEHWVWHSVPRDLGFGELPVWWPIVTLSLAGILVILVIRSLPGHGGHVPVHGLGGGATPGGDIPGVLLAAAASLVLGAVVGPEAPLIALGSGLALVAVRRTRISGDPQASALIAACGSAAAISAIFGNPLVAAIIFLELAELARRQTMLLILPALVSSGVGALVFTGLGSWTGFEIGELALPDLGPGRLDVADVLWTIPLAAVVAVATRVAFSLGWFTAGLAERRLAMTTMGAAVLAGSAAAAYAVITDRSPAEVALSGQATLTELASAPEAWTTVALALLILFKGLAFGLSLGVFRGGSVFPAILIGAAIGVIAGRTLPGLEFVPALAVGMAAGVAVTGLPVTSVALVAMLLGSAASSQVPTVILAVVTALVAGELLEHRAGIRPTHQVLKRKQT